MVKKITLIALSLVIASSVFATNTSKKVAATSKNSTSVKKSQAEPAK